MSALTVRKQFITLWANGMKSIWITVTVRSAVLAPESAQKKLNGKYRKD
jgi:hypothetical protein